MFLIMSQISIIRILIMKGKQMDNNKQIENIRKRNMELNKQIDDLKLKLEYHKELNTESYQAAKDLIADLENIREEWIQTLQRLHDMESEYQGLISDMKEIKANMVSAFRLN